MAETDSHRDEMQEYGINVLTDHYATDEMVYVSGNNFVYYTEGVKKDCVSPDTYVVKGVPAGQRPVFKTWEEGGRVPSFVLEVTSRKTRREDLGEKMTKYRDELRVPEYFLFDLTGEWIPEKLRGFVLVEGTYQRIEPDSRGRLLSRELGLELTVECGHLRFYVPGATKPLPTRTERADRERERADRERERADRERERADRGRERAEREQERAERAEEELLRLRARLDDPRAG